MLFALSIATIKSNEECVMLTFIISVAVVFIAVELFVRLVVDPLILGKFKKSSKISQSKLDPTFKLATETMYDGGKAHKPEASKNAAKNENTSKDEVKS